MEKPVEDLPVVLGKINGLFGVRGWVKVRSFTDPLDNILQYKTWMLNWPNNPRQQSTQYQLKQGQNHGKGIIALLEDISDRTAAESLLGAEISVSRTLLQKLPEDEYYWSDLIDLKVINTQQKELGTVNHLLETGANDVLVVKQGRQECLIPFVDPWVIQVDLEAGQIEVEWEPGF